MMRKIVSTALALMGMCGVARAEFAQVSDDLRIHYQTTGQGNQVILLVPGWTMSGDVFERQLAHFKISKDYTVIAIDPRSQGLTTHTAEGNFYEQHGRDLDAFMRKLGLKDVVLGGWSNGGFDVLSYVHQFGSANLKGLVLIDAAPTGTAADNKTEWVWFRRDDADQYRSYFTQGTLLDRAKTDDEFAHFMVDDASPAYLDWIGRIMAQTADGTAALLNESSAYQDYADDLQKLEGKTKLLYFVHDSWGDVVGKWGRSHTPSATVVSFGKHLSFWEHPEHFNDALDAFLGQVKGRPAAP